MRVLVLLLALPAAAQPVTGRVSTGLGFAPTYPGSSEFEVVPVLSGKISLGPAEAQFDNLGVELDLLPSPILSFGPVFRRDGGRRGARACTGSVFVSPGLEGGGEGEGDDNLEFGDDCDGSLLPTVESGLEIGISAGLTFPEFGDGTLILGTRIVTEVNDGHGGTLVDVSAAYAQQVTPRLTLGGGVSATYASEGYMDSYFSLGFIESLDAGLGEFEAGAGLRDVTVGAAATYALTPGVSATGYARVQRLLGDAADSPITEAGAANQLQGGLVVTFGF